MELVVESQVSERGQEYLAQSLSLIRPRERGDKVTVVNNEEKSRHDVDATVKLVIAYSALPRNVCSVLSMCSTGPPFDRHPVPPDLELRGKFTKLRPCCRATV